MSGEVAIGIDWMSMLLLLSISGSSRIDQQLGKNVAMNLVGELFNKIPYTMFPYDAIHIKEFNPHMPCQEILPLRPAAGRSGCVLRPNNRCVLDDSVPIHERILVPACPIAPHLLMEDIGVASPLYDLCHVLGIPSIYTLPIQLIPWPMPYPIGVPWPVIRYGKLDDDERDKGYIVVSAGGKAKLYVYDVETPYNLNNVNEAATIHMMGPRPLFCTPCRAVQLSNTLIGVLIPFPSSLVGDTEGHPLCRLYDAKHDSFLCWDAESNEAKEVSHQWVEENVIPMCSDVLVKAWSPCMEKLVKHIGYKGYSKGGEKDPRECLKKDRVYVMGKIVPPRDCDVYDQKVWVSMEVRHTIGNLKNMANADMITMKVAPEDLMPMVDTSGYDVEGNGISSKKYTSSSGVKKNKRDAPEQIIINRFIFASKTVA